MSNLWLCVKFMCQIYDYINMWLFSLKLAGWPTTGICVSLHAISYQRHLNGSSFRV